MTMIHNCILQIQDKKKTKLSQFSIHMSRQHRLTLNNSNKYKPFFYIFKNNNKIIYECLILKKLTI